MPQGTTEDKPPENPLAFVRQLIESPPVALKIDRVSVQNAQFDVRILDKKNEAHLRVRDLNFSASLLAGKKKLKPAKAEVEKAEALSPKVEDSRSGLSTPFTPGK